MKTITLKCEGGVTREAKAVAIERGLALYKDQDWVVDRKADRGFRRRKVGDNPAARRPWSVCHMNSGMRIATVVTRREGKQLLGQLAGIARWSAYQDVQKELGKDEFRRLRELVREVVGKYRN